jgi:hypothetical protein
MTFLNRWFFYEIGTALHRNGERVLNHRLSIFKSNFLQRSYLTAHVIINITRMNPF